MIKNNMYTVYCTERRLSYSGSPQPGEKSPVEKRLAGREVIIAFTLIVCDWCDRHINFVCLGFEFDSDNVVERGHAAEDEVGHNV
jgi:hypothetical protein